MKSRSPWQRERINPAGVAQHAAIQMVTVREAAEGDTVAKLFGVGGGFVEMLVG